MKQALEDYYREVEEKAESFAQRERMTTRIDHLDAFNLGRKIQRIEHSQHNLWVRGAWLLAGLVIGLACGRLLPDFQSVAARQLFTRVSVLVRGSEQATLGRAGRTPR